jgi:hypothetical protein
MTVNGAPCQQGPWAGCEWAEIDPSNCELQLHHALRCPTKTAGK